MRGRGARTAVGAAGATAAVLVTVAVAAVQTADALSLRQAAGQRIILPLPGCRAPGRLLDGIGRGEAAGVILFGRNVCSRTQLRRLVRRLQGVERPEELRFPLLVMIDQEGGLVKRLPGAPRHSPAALGAIGRSGLARREGVATALNLRGVGINVDLAPVLDVARPGSFVERTRRSFGRAAGRVARIGGAFAEGLADAGVLATAKHFPGIGAVRANEDLLAGRVGLSTGALRAIDERPFASAFAAKLPMTMLSTAVYPALDGVPAVISRRIATVELRGALRFGGVSITDDLEVPVLRPWGSPQRLAVRSVLAGADLLLFGQRYDTGVGAARALVRAVRSGRLTRAELEQGARRVLALRAALRG
jgi:beta-N-acetylhexosaminidase